MPTIPRVFVPTWARSSLRVGSLATGGLTWWTVEAVPVFRVKDRQCVPALELVPMTEPPIDSKRLVDAVGSRRRTDGVLPRILAGDEHLAADWEMRTSSAEHWTIGVGASSWDRWREFGRLRLTELEAASDEEALQVLLREWKTTTPWALLVPFVIDGLVQRLGLSHDLDDLEAAMAVLGRIRPHRGQPARTANLPLPRQRSDDLRPEVSDVAVLRAAARYIEKGTSRDSVLDDLLGPDRASTPSIEQRARNFSATADRQVVAPIVVPFEDDTLELPVAELTRALGVTADALTDDLLFRALISRSRQELVSFDGAWRPEWTLAPEVEDAVGRVVLAFVEQTLARWVAEPAHAERLLLIAGGLPDRLAGRVL